MSLAVAIFLGMVQGLTEFLPVSSSGHLVIAQHFLPGFEQPGVLFDIVLHLGTLLAVLLYFRRDMLALLRGFGPGAAGTAGRRLILLLSLGTVPAVVAALLLRDRIERSFEQLPAVGIALCLTGLWLLVSKRFDGKGARDLGDIGFWDAAIVGSIQSVALFPGVSRSGSTIVGGLARGLSRDAAARFSFLLAVPAILGASVYGAKDVSALRSDALAAYGAGFLVAFLVGYWAIGLVVRFLASQKFHLFGYYCLSLGSIVLVYHAIGPA